MITNTHNLMQLATIVYSDSDDEIRYTKNNIIRKIIQLSILKNENKFQMVSEISKSIKDTLGLVIFETEIWSSIIKYEQLFVIKNKAESREFEDNKHALISLTQKEFSKIYAKSNATSFDELIAKFYKEKCDESIPLEEVSDLILDFIFKHFVENIKNYQELVVKNSNRYSEHFLLGLKSTIHYEYTKDQCEIINDFIDYEDSSKNKYIFYVITLALEYCITLNLPNGSIPNEILMKKLYLDSNIIFRALGLNGEDRKDKILLFLDKCVKTGQKLFITNIAEAEFEKTLEFQCQGLSNLVSATQKSYNYLADENDLTSFYLGEKTKNPRLNPRIFRADIQQKYIELKEKYAISIEYIKGINKKPLVPQINSLFAFKYPNVENLNYKETCKTDIYNLKYLSTKTSPTESYPNILFITADRKLLYWIKNNELYNDYNNFALQPSDWLSFMLRFVSRSDDEYKSFVDLLKITPINDLHFEPYQVEIILGLINDVESNPTRQEKIIKNMISNQFNEVKSLSETRDKEKFIITIDSIVSKELEELYKEDITKMKEESKSLLFQKDIEINQKKLESATKSQELSKLDDALKDLSQDNISSEAKLLEKEVENIRSKLIIKYLVFILLSIGVYLLLKSPIKNINTSNSLLLALLSTLLLNIISSKIERLNLPTFKDYSKAKAKNEEYKNNL